MSLPNTMTAMTNQSAALATPGLLAWVDGVGCFQLLPGKQWRLGGPGGEPAADIVVCGDLSRRAAEIIRRGSRYVLNRYTDKSKLPIRPQELVNVTPFHLGTRDDIQFEFSRTHPLSASATLHLTSRQRISPVCDGIVLVADTCIFAASDSSHVVCSDAVSPVVLLIGGDGRWYAKGNASFTLNGLKTQGLTALEFPCRLDAGETVIALEQIVRPKAE